MGKFLLKNKCLKKKEWQCAKSIDCQGINGGEESLNIIKEKKDQEEEERIYWKNILFKLSNP
jgi:hypothetical protein